ncbi:hypothetical protein AGMMS50222_02960 [Endomicrobiia bacterium]|nr:hypothetical protein AGMMS49950_01980 [Endomicrobiia bacterium]GHT74213.1 hypothetical protein AGMMS50222_02960 [Endomicrobiia bacterium]
MEITKNIQGKWTKGRAKSEKYEDSQGGRDEEVFDYFIYDDGDGDKIY